MTSRMAGRTARLALVVAVVAWAVLVVAAPWLGRAAVAPPIDAGLATAIYAAGSLVCHQHSARSFHVAGAQLPVCARCTGLYVSTAVGVIGVALFGRGFRRWRLTHGNRHGMTWRALLAGAAVPTVVTVVAEWLGAWQPSSIARAAAGVPLGLVVGAILTEFTSFGVD